MPRTLNPLRFGFNPRGFSFEQTVALTRVAEEAGFEVVAFSDHPPENNLEGWTLAVAVGALTQRIKLTHSTLNIPFRNPGMLAKMAASLDVITGGRVELTLGAGGQEPHYRAYGIPFGSPGERFTDLKDAVAIMRGMWTGEPFSYQGRQHRVEEATTQPQPVQGAIPVIIGAGGPRMLRYTGAVADGWIKNGGWPASLEEYKELLGQVEEGAERAGRDPRTVRRVLNGSAVIGEGDVAARIPESARSRGGLLGTPERILETIGAYAEAGVDEFHVSFPPSEAEEQLKRFGQEVIARVRG